MAAVLLAGGAKGKRFALPNSRILIHQPLGGVQGQATDIDIHAREILRMREALNTILCEFTGQEYDKISQDTESSSQVVQHDSGALEIGLGASCASLLPRALVGLGKQPCPELVESSTVQVGGGDDLLLRCPLLE